MRGDSEIKKSSFELWLVWQNVETRQRYHIGRLVCENNNYTFSYEKSGYRRKLDEVLDNGYRPLLAFPDIDKVYTSQKLFGPFARRLPDRRRPDYQTILQELGIARDSTEMEVLRATGGILATDAYEFVPPIVLGESKSTFNVDFFVAGWRYYEGDSVIDSLMKGDVVDFLLDPENNEDSRAVIVMSVNGEKLGYIPAFYSGWMFEIIEKSSNYQAKIESINLHAVPHRKVNISIVREINHAVDIDEVLNDRDQLRLVMC